MSSLVDELLGYKTFLSEADKEDTDSPDNTKDNEDLNKEKDDTNDDNTDVTEDDKTDSDNTDEDPTNIDTPDDTDTTDSDESTSDDSDAPNESDLNKSVSDVVNDMDWEKKLYISNNFEEIYSAFNNLSKFITEVILKSNSNINSEFILKGILTKVTFNINHLKEIMEGTLIVDLEYKDLDKLLEIFGKDLDNINKQLKLFSKNMENNGKK